MRKPAYGKEIIRLTIDVEVDSSLLEKTKQPELVSIITTALEKEELMLRRLTIQKQHRTRNLLVRTYG